MMLFHVSFKNAIADLWYNSTSFDKAAEAWYKVLEIDKMNYKIRVYSLL